MKLMSVKAIKEYYNPPKLEVLEEWLEKNSYGEFKSSEMGDWVEFSKETKEWVKIPYEKTEEYVIAMGLWYFSNKYPNASEDKIFTSAYLLSNYLDDFQFIQYDFTYLPWQLDGVKLIISLAGGLTSYNGFEFTLPAYRVNNKDEKTLEDFTRFVLPYLEKFYFQSQRETVIKIIEENDIEITPDIVLSFASTEEKQLEVYNRLSSLIKKGTAEEIKAELLNIVNKEYNWGSRDEFN